MECGHETNGVELAVAGQPYTMYRCVQCDSTTWKRGGETVPLDEVTAALQDATAARAGRRSARQRSDSL